MDYLETCRIIDEVFAKTEKKEVLDFFTTKNEEVEAILGQRTEDDREIRNILRKFQAQAKLEYFLNNRDMKYSQRFFIFSDLAGNYGGLDLNKLTDPVKFKDIVEYLAKNFVHKINELEDIDSKEKVLASVLDTSYFGKFNLKTQDGHVIYDEVKFSKIAKDLEAKIKEMGALSLLNVYFNVILSTCYDSTNQRYLMPRRKFNYGDKIYAALPHNYIIQLCIKNLRPNENVDSVEQEKFIKFLQLASDFCFLYDTQDFFRVTSVLFLNQYDNDLLYKNSLEDNIYRFRHFSKNNFVYNLKILLKPCDGKEAEVNKILGFNLREYLDLVSRIYKNNQTGLILKSLSEFSTEKKEIIKKIASRFPVNKNYLLPTDFNKVENAFDDSPFILNDNGTFLILDLNLSTVNFYQVILNRINWNKDLIDSGKNIEKLLVDYCNRYGFKIYEGNYKESNNRECDLVLETDTDIVFIESKKKTVTSLALSGDKPQLALDFCESFMAAQEQTLFHERHLRSKGKIDFLDGKTLVYKGQEIHRISVTLFDLFIFNDHFVSENLFKYLQRKKFSLLTKANKSTEYRKLKSRLDVMNKKMEHLNAFSKELKSKYYPDERQFNMNTWFLSLEQVLHLFEKAYSKSLSFAEMLKRFRGISSQTGDFYSSFEYFDNIKK